MPQKDLQIGGGGEEVTNWVRTGEMTTMIVVFQVDVAFC